MTIVKKLTTIIASELAARGNGLVTDVETALLDNERFLYIHAELVPDGPLDRRSEASTLIRDVLASCPPSIIDKNAWGAVLRHRGRIVQIVRDADI